MTRAKKGLPGGSNRSSVAQQFTVMKVYRAALQEPALKLDFMDFMDFMDFRKSRHAT